jgi:hypothetical protein
MSRFQHAHLRKPNKRVPEPSLVGEPTSQSKEFDPRPRLIGLKRHGNPFDQNSKAYCSRAGDFADLIVVVALSTVDLGFLIARKRSQPFPKVFQETICFCLMLEF